MMATKENITSENMSDVKEVVPFKFIHLRAHSAYSLLEGALKPAVWLMRLSDLKRLPLA